MKTMSATLPPLVKRVSVPMSQEAAFARFTEGIGSWWPKTTHSVGQEKTEDVVMECVVGGRFYEKQRDGTTCVWGEVTLWEPPNRVAFTWHPDRTPDTAQNVQVVFRKHGDGTEVELTHSDWDTFGSQAAEKRKDYDRGWGGVLELFAAS